MSPNPSIERTSQRPLRALCAAAHVERQAPQPIVHRNPTENHSCLPYFKAAASAARFDSSPINRQCEHLFATARFASA